MKHYREVKCEDRLPSVNEWTAYLNEREVMCIGFVTVIGQWYDCESSPTDDVTVWLEEYDPEAEARERHKKAIEYFNRPEAEFESDILQKTILIASGLTK